MQNFLGRTRCVLGNVKVADHACESRTYIQTSRTCSWMGVLPKFLLIKFKCLDWHIHVKFYLKPQSVLKWEEVRSLRCENSVLFLSKKPSHFHDKGFGPFALGLILRGRVFGIQKWPVILSSQMHTILCLCCWLYFTYDCFGFQRSFCDCFGYSIFYQLPFIILPPALGCICEWNVSCYLHYEGLFPDLGV